MVHKSSFYGVLCRLHVLIQEVRVEAYLEMLQNSVGSMLLRHLSIHIFGHVRWQVKARNANELDSEHAVILNRLVETDLCVLGGRPVVVKDAQAVE